MFSNNELFEFSQVFTKYQDNFTESPHFLNVMNKLHIAKLEYIFYENGIPNDPVIFYENKDLVTGELYQTRKDLNYGIFILKTFFDKNANITDEIREVNSYICEIAYLGLSRIKLVNNAIYYLLHDELTGIYNQNFFVRHVTELINKSDISDYAALYLNIRNCRYLNSVFGNRITDRIIVTLAKTLKSMIVIEDGECVSRLGGDFFTLIVKKEHLEKFTNLLTNFPIEFDYESDHIVYPLSLKAGIALLDETFDTFDKIMMTISAAHSVAKTTKAEPPIVYFSKSLIETKFLKDKISNELNEDLKNNKLFVYYQPYIELSNDDKKIIGCEALLRWRHDDQMIQASDIIPLAESAKLIYDIDLFVIEKVCKKISEWKKQGYKIVPVSCNISEFDLKISNLAPKLIEIINKYDVDYSEIAFEFNETAFVNEPVLMKNFVEEIRKYGIRVGLEDYSNSFLPYKLFSESAFDYVKIDYKNIDTTNSNMIMILDSIIKLSNSLGIKVIVKGLCDEDIIDRSIKNGCTVFQSEYFEKPLSERFFENKIKNQ